MASGRTPSNLPLKRPISPEQPVDLASITFKLAPKIRETAIYKGVNLIEELNAGHRLEDRALLQLNHAFDLGKYSTPDPAMRGWIDRHRGELREALAHNDLARHLNETGQSPAAGVFEYKNEQFDLRQGKDLMKREHEYFLKNEQWMSPLQIKQVKGELLQTTRDLGKTHPLGGLHQEQSQLARPIAEVADAWDGRKPGSRPAGESDALFRYATYPQERIQTEHQVYQQRHAESERIRQEQMSWFTDEELKKKFGPDLKMAAWQLGAREAANELLYGAEQGINFLRGKLGMEKAPRNRRTPKLTPEEISLRSRFALQSDLSKLNANRSFTVGLGKVVKGRQGFNWYESLGVGQGIKKIQQQGNYAENPNQERLKRRIMYNQYDIPYDSLPYSTGEYLDD